MPCARRVGRKSVKSHDVAAGVYPGCTGEDSAWEINRSELALLVSQKAVVIPVGGTNIHSDNLTDSVDIQGTCGGSAGGIKRGEACFLIVSCGRSTLNTDA